jgi:hypothetical protein
MVFWKKLKFWMTQTLVTSILIETKTCEARSRYVTTSEKPVGVIMCGYFDMLLFQDDICVST